MPQPTRGRRARGRRRNGPGCPRRAGTAAFFAAGYDVEALEGRRLLAFAPIGPEFPVNQAAAGTQGTPAIAADADGDLVVIWISNGNTAVGPNQDASGYGVYARRYNAAGAALGDEFRVNTFTTGDQYYPSVAMDADGDFVVAWTSANQDGSSYGIYAQRYDAAGSPRGGEFRVNAFTANNQRFPSVAMDVDGDFVVAWESYGQDEPETLGVYARRYAADGSPRGGEFLVNRITGDNEQRPAAAMDADGDFVIAWEAFGQDGAGSYGIYAKRYTATGAERVPPAPLLGTGGAFGNEFRVNTTTAAHQRSPSVAMDYSGDFVVAWTSYAPEADGGVAAQRFTAAGAPAGGEIRVNDTPGGAQIVPRVAADADGDFVVTWTSFGQEPAPGTGGGVYMKRYTGAGAGAGEVRVNTATANNQLYGAVALDADGDAAFAWQSLGQDAPGTFGVYAQRFQETTETAGPIVSGVVAAGDRVGAGERLASAVTSIAVQFSENLSAAGGADGANSATNPANYGLTRDGADVATLITSVSFSLNTSTRKYEAVLTLSAPLADGTYVLTARAALSGLAGNALDGNFDGVPGEHYSLSFVVHSVVRVGPESRANATTSGDQEQPVVAMDADGDYVVAWQSYGQDGSRLGVYASRFDAAGMAQQVPGQPGTTEFRVNTFTAGDQDTPRVAMDANGDFVVAWESLNQDGGGDGVYAKRYNAAGQELAPPFPTAGTGALGNEFRVNAFTTSQQNDPTVAMDADGNFVVAWQSGTLFGGTAQDGSGYGVYARRFNAAGVPQPVPGQPAGTTEFRVNTYTLGSQVEPQAAMDADGDFVVAWNSFGQDGSEYGVYACRYSAAGAAQQVPGQPADTTEFRVNTVTTFDQAAARVAMDPEGDFVIAFQSFGQGGGGGYGIYASRYSAAGVAQQVPGQPADTTEFGVNTFSADDQLHAAVAMDADGDFVVAWHSVGQDGSGDGVYACRFDGAGVAQHVPGQPAGTTEFRVNSTPADAQRFPEVAMDADGDFVVAWQSTGQDGSGFGVYAQRYGPNQPPISLGIASFTVPQNEADTVLPLWDFFEDPNTPDNTLNFSVVVNTNPGLFSSTAVSNAAGTLTLDYAPGQSGQATLTVRATDPGGLVVDTSFIVTVTPGGGGAPRVAAVYVDGTAWQPAFRQFLQTAGLGSSGLGFLIAGGAAQLDELPWSNVNRVHVVFSKDVNVDAADLALRGVNTASYALDAAAFAYDAATFTASWTLAGNARFANDRLLLDLNADAGGVTDKGAAGALDGEWANGTSAFPSGDGAAGGNFRFQLNFLPGDVNRNGGVVNSIDVQQTRIRQFLSPGNPGTPPTTYAAFFDVDGSAFINAIDVQQVRIRQFSSLPNGNPGLAAPPARGALFAAPAARRTAWGEAAGELR